MFRILVVEGDSKARELLEQALYGGGYEPLLAADSAGALELLEHKFVDLILVDVAQPRSDGNALIEQLRRSGMQMPILAISERPSIAEKAVTFRLGADDFLARPLDNEELLLHIHALLRRARISNEHRLTVGDTQLFYDTLTVIRHGRATELPPKEFMLLFKLLSCPNKVFTRQQLMDEIWDLESDSDSHTISVHINRLRNRFRGNPDFCIVTVRNLGYKAVRTG